jgi:hypothetical protein
LTFSPLATAIIVSATLPNSKSLFSTLFAIFGKIEEYCTILTFWIPTSLSA